MQKKGLRMDKIQLKTTAIKHVRKVQEFLHSQFNTVCRAEKYAPPGKWFELYISYQDLDDEVNIKTGMGDFIDRLDPNNNPCLYCILDINSYADTEYGIYFTGRFASGPKLPTFGF